MIQIIWIGEEEKLPMEEKETSNEMCATWLEIPYILWQSHTLLET